MWTAPQDGHSFKTTVRNFPTHCPIKCKPMQERGRFFLIILNLATIEVIMHLEEQTLDEIMTNSELLGRREVEVKGTGTRLVPTGLVPTATGYKS